MAYDEKLKANSEIFEKIRFIPVPESYILKPILPDLVEQEAMFYMINSRLSDVRKFLPLVVAETPDEASKKLADFALRTVAKVSILYCIRPNDPQIPLGYIHVNSPISATGLEDWSVDFWMGEQGRGKGLMTASLGNLLAYLQNNLVPVVKALVDKENTASISVLERVGFARLNEDAEGKRFLYSIKLNE